VIPGSLDDYQSVLEAVWQVNVVICAVPTKQALEQKTMIRDTKEAGCVMVSGACKPQFLHNWVG
jgi:hypothetical protein